MRDLILALMLQAERQESQRTQNCLAFGLKIVEDVKNEIEFSLWLAEQDFHVCVGNSLLPI